MKNKFLTISLISAITCFNLVPANAQVITVDNYYNQETKKGKAGNLIPFHYLWNDVEASGFSILGDAFMKNGAKVLNVVSEKPTLKNLAKSDVFIIVDPDNLKDNPHPNFMDAADSTAISAWVKTGGVLFLMANDEANADLKYFNLLAEKFGFIFNSDLILHVTDDKHFEDGGLNTLNSSLFKTSERIFIKDASSISIKHTAQPLLKTKKGENVLVISKYGKGTVLAVGDPWLYNEYTNGRLPKDFQNRKAADDVAKFLIERSTKK